MSEIALTIREIDKDDNHPLLQEEIRPLEDDGKRTLTNSIVRKQFVQKRNIPGCKQFALLLVDSQGNAISEQRLIEQKPIGRKTVTTFELKAGKGFDNGNYYLVIMNFDSNQILCATKYSINIVFSNDFDF